MVIKKIKEFKVRAAAKKTRFENKRDMKRKKKTLRLRMETKRHDKRSKIKHELNVQRAIKNKRSKTRKVSKKVLKVAGKGLLMAVKESDNFLKSRNSSFLDDSPKKRKRKSKKRSK